jgi:hypothetical protein
VTVDNLPGQFANRQAWVIGGSRVYHLTIWPWHEPAFAAYQDEADLLWKTVTESLTLGLQPSGVATAVPTAVSGNQSEPPPAALQIEGVAQTSAVGSYCWTAVCADMIGTPTPPEPLVIPGGAPLKATFTLPVSGTPTDLTLDVVKADPSIELPDNARGYRWWRFAQGTRVSISSSPQVQADLQLAPGTYVLSLFASWDTIGSANWGFLIEVQGPGSTATPGSASGPTPSAPVPAGWATFASELGYQISYPGDWELSEVDTGLYSLLQDPNNQDSIVFSIDERNMLTLADARDAAAQDLESPVITDLALTGAKGFTVEGDLASSFAQDLHVKSGYLEVGGKVVIFGCGVGDCDVPRWDQVMNTLRIGR